MLNMKDDPELEKVVNKIFEENMEYLQKMGIRTKEEALQKCMRMPDYMAKRRPKKYGPKCVEYDSYQNDVNLREIIAFLGEKDGEKRALFYGTEKATIHGHIADEIVSGKNNGKIILDQNVKKELYKKIRAEFKDTITEEDKNKYIEGIGMTIDNICRICEEGGLDNYVKDTIEEINIKNGYKEGYPKEKNNEKSGDKNGLKLTDEQKRMCRMLGVTEDCVKDVITVRATDVMRKTDGYSMAENQINENHGYVTILQCRTEKTVGPDRYYGLQDGKMVLYGFNETNEDLDRIFGGSSSTKYNGRLVTPLRAKDGNEDVSITDIDGSQVKMQIDDNSDLCTHDIEDYRDEMQKLLVDLNTEMQDAKDHEATFEEMRDILNKYNVKSEQIAIKYDITIENNENIVEDVTDELEENIGFDLDDDGEEMDFEEFEANEKINEDGYDPQDPAYKHSQGLGPKTKF